MHIVNFWVDVYDGNNQRLGRGPLRGSNWYQTSKLSACGDFGFDVSAADPNIAVLAEKLTVVFRYAGAQGGSAEFGAGIIDKIIKAVDAQGNLVFRVTGNDLGRELSYRSVRTLSLADELDGGVYDGPTQIMAYAPDGWQISNPPANTQLPIYVGYDGETVLAALVRVVKHTGEHFRISMSRSLTWLGARDTFLPSGVRAVQHVFDPVGVERVEEICLIESLEEEADASELVTRIIPRGSGNGSTILTLSAATAPPPAGFTLNVVENYLENAAAVAKYGVIERVVDFKEIGPLSNTTPDIIAAANMLLQVSAQYLSRAGSPQKYWRIVLSHTNLLLEVGTTLPVIYQKRLDGVVIYSVDETLNIIEVRNVLNQKGVYTTEILVSASDHAPQSDASVLAAQISSAKVLSAHQQLGPSTDTLTWRDEMDSAHGASFRFWLGDEYTSIQRATFRFRIQPLRSTVKSVGGASTSTSAGGGGTATSSNGGGANLTSSGTPHGHNVTVYHSRIPGMQPIVFDGTFLYSFLPTSTFQTQPEVPASGHTHTMTIPAHTHNVNIPQHTHGVTASVTMKYGIFEESRANTLELADLVIKLNAGSDLRTSVEDIGDGWFALELTEFDLIDAVFRPSQEDNELAITTSENKTARIEAQITIRGVVQAVNYFA